MTPGERRHVLLLVFFSGAAVLGAELTASRLLAPAFGTSLLVWSAVIGLMLLYLAVGYSFGGRFADRYARPGVLYGIVLAGAFLLGLVPFLATPVLDLGSGALSGGRYGVLGGCFVALLALFAAPITLLGMVTPFAIRLLVPSVEEAGRTAGRVYAISTAGSLVGAFLPSLLLIPQLGTRNTFLAVSLPVLILAGLGLVRRSRRAGGLAVLLAAGLLASSATYAGRPIRAGGEVLFETESAHNYIRVERRGPEVVLTLNEGMTVDSLYRPGSVWSGRVWNRFLLAPLLLPEGRRVERLLVLGSAAGTVARGYDAVFHPEVVHQVEIDSEIVAAGREFFDLKGAVFEMDARHYLRTTEVRYDVIVLDAYRVPYVPFHLATREFFALVREHLNEGGVVVANVLSMSSDRALVMALGATLATEFPLVLELPPPDGGLMGLAREGNTLLFALNRPGTFKRRTPADSTLARLADRELPRLRPFAGGGPVLTDDRAPVEEIVHGMLWRLMTGVPGTTREGPQGDR